MGPQGSLAGSFLFPSWHSIQLLFVPKQHQGKKITLFLVDGEPDGIKTLELGGWSGMGTVFPRNKLREYGSDESARKPGVYFLFGKENEESSIASAYIGHADNIIDRLNTHNRDDAKEFWYQTVVFTSKDDSITRAHAKYIESRCIQLAYEAKHFGYHLTNGNEPLPANLPKSDIPVMEGFLENLNLLLAAIGYPILQKMESKNESDMNNPLFICKNADGKAQGTARMTNEGFIVYKGSVATGRLTESVAERNKRVIEKLVSEGILRQDGDVYVFERDYNFGKPSAPADLILGHSANGWDVWRTAEGKTLSEVYRRQ